MNSAIVESVIIEMEEFIDSEFEPSVDQVEKWALELRNAIKEDAA